MKLAFISKMSPSWNQTYEYDIDSMKSTGDTIIKYFVDRCGPDIIIDIEDIVEPKSLPKEFKESLPIDLGYYVNDELLGYLDGIIIKYGYVYFMFTPTDEIKSLVKDVLSNE